MPTKKKETPVEEVKTEAVETPVEETETVEAPANEAVAEVEEAPKAKGKAKKAVEETVEETAKADVPVIFESLDGRKLQVSIGRFVAEGKRIEVPREMEEEVTRLLKEGKYLVQKIA